MHSMKGAAYGVAFLATIPAANWLIVQYGVIPVGFGLMAPAGVLMVGASFVLRDLLHKEEGPKAVIAAILCGAILSSLVAPPELVFASVTAFLFSELADMGVYQPMLRRGMVQAMLLSSMVGSIVDSAIFLWLAFGDLQYLAGQILGKFEMVLIGVMLYSMIRGWRRHEDV